MLELMSRKLQKLGNFKLQKSQRKVRIFEYHMLWVDIYMIEMKEFDQSECNINRICKLISIVCLTNTYKHHHLLVFFSISELAFAYLCALDLIPAIGALQCSGISSRQGPYEYAMVPGIEQALHGPFTVQRRPFTDILQTVGESGLGQNFVFVSQNFG